MSSPFDAIGGLLSKAVEMAAPIAMDALLPGSSELLGAANNLLGGAIGDAACSMVDQLGQEMGAPKFLTDLCKDAIRGAVQQHSQPCDPDCMDHARNQVGDKISDFKNQLMSGFNELLQDYKKDCQEKYGAGGKGGHGGKGGAGGAGGTGGESFMVVLAKILGELENKQFDKVKKASQDVSDALGATDGPNGKGSGSTQSNEKGQFDKMETLKGESQTMSTLAQSVQSALDGIFKAASTASQKA